MPSPGEESIDIECLKLSDSVTLYAKIRDYSQNSQMKRTKLGKIILHLIEYFLCDSPKNGYFNRLVTIITECSVNFFTNFEQDVYKTTHHHKF